MYKIAISDLDGTLLGPNHRMSSYTKESVLQWLDNDRKFVIATGRHYLEAINVQNEFTQSTYLISSNGARVHNKAGEVLLKQDLPEHIAQTICSIDFHPQVQVNVFTDTHWYTNFHLEDLEGSRLGNDFQPEVTDLKKLDKSDIIKVVFWGENDLLETVYQQLQTQFNAKINLTFSLPTCLEVMHADTNKGSAVEAVLAEKKLTLSDAIAFGDGMNDVEMLQVVGKPMLMANSQTALMNALPDAEVTLSSAEHGVAVKLIDILADSTSR